MENSIRLPRQKSLLGWVLRPVQWFFWRLNRPLLNEMVAVNQRNSATQCANAVAEFEGRIRELQKLADYTRTHADNILQLVYDTHRRIDALQEHADNILGIARHAEGQSHVTRQMVEAETAQRASLVPPHSISPLMMQAITIDYIALTRRIVMIENVLVELQAVEKSEDKEADVLPLSATTRRLAS